MAKGNKPPKDDKKNKKAKKLGITKAPSGSIFDRQGDSAVG